jgi:hypothetical protein
MSILAPGGCGCHGNDALPNLSPSAIAHIGVEVVNIPVELFQIAFVLAVTVVPVIVMTRLIAGHEDFGFDPIARSDAVHPWPKGVQEEEPQPWRFGTATS